MRRYLQCLIFAAAMGASGAAQAATQGWATLTLELIGESFLGVHVDVDTKSLDQDGEIQWSYESYYYTEITREENVFNLRGFMTEHPYGSLFEATFYWEPIYPEEDYYETACFSSVRGLCGGGGEGHIDTPALGKSHFFANYDLDKVMDVSFYVGGTMNWSGLYYHAGTWWQEPDGKEYYVSNLDYELQFRVVGITGSESLLPSESSIPPVPLPASAVLLGGGLLSLLGLGRGRRVIAGARGAVARRRM